jgi:dTDP-4-dehydrorhamnose reductase
MKIVVTGGNGQLGRTFHSIASSMHQIIPLSKEELDITNKEMVDKQLQQYRPDYVIHTAAYTAVDQCEIEPVKAFHTNTIGSLNIALSCNKIGSKLVYISSDYVFDGSKKRAYTENDSSNPKSIYGLSKWLGEELVLKAQRDSYVVRTSWLYGHGGKNFVNTMAMLAMNKKEVYVVDDQIGSPTYTNDLVSTILKLLGKPYGVYHISNDGQCSWYQLAQTIYESVDSNPNLVKPTSTSEYRSLAQRPAFSVFNLNKLEENGIEKPRHWQEAVKEFLKIEFKRM